MVGELLKSHAFILPSLIENSPNSLAEAMLVGTPSVASFVGGVPSMAKDNESALFFPSGDEAVLAEQIRRIFLDDDLARRLSVRAREVARVRHSKNKIVGDMLEIYESVTLPTSADGENSLYTSVDHEIVRNN
jgi:glycosyltransferase involved in cell wall biosynthesis